MATETDTSRIRLTRTSAYVNRIRKFAVYIDGEKVGKIANGSTEDYEIEPGDHEVVVKIDWCRSHTIRLWIDNGETVELGCGSVATAGETLFAILRGPGYFIDVWFLDDTR